MSRPRESPELSDKHSPPLTPLKETGPPLLLSSQQDPEQTHERTHNEVKQIPWRYRLIAFWLIIFFATGSSYAQLILSPLKSTVRKELKITNAQYGALASADNLINTILPLIGGIGMDYWGAT